MHQPRMFVYVDQIAVRHASGGVGTALVAAVCAAAKEAGCTDVVTEVWEFNERARTFFGDGLGSPRCAASSNGRCDADELRGRRGSHRACANSCTG